MKTIYNFELLNKSRRVRKKYADVVAAFVGYSNYAITAVNFSKEMTTLVPGGNICCQRKTFE